MKRPKLPYPKLSRVSGVMFGRPAVYTGTSHQLLDCLEKSKAPRALSFSSMDFPVLSSKKHLKAVSQCAPTAHGDMLLTVPGLLTVEESQACIDAAEAYGFQHQSSRGPAYGEALRSNDRLSVQDESIARSIWHDTGLSKLLQKSTIDGMLPVGCNPNIRFYRYTPGHHFGKHIDDSVELEDGKRTWYTLLIYLSGNQQDQVQDNKQDQALHQTSSQRGKTKRARKDLSQAGSHQGNATVTAPEVCKLAVQPLQGGETVFYNERGKVVASVQPKAGLALLHLHGEDRCMEHEALLVRQGTKYVLRTDVVYAPVGR